MIFTIGTEGDLRPYLALGRELADAGHHVTLATSREFEPVVTSQKLTFAPLTADYLEMMRRNPSVMDQPNQRAMLRVLVAETQRMARSWAAEAMAAARDADLIIGSGNVSLLGASIAERLRLPYIRSQLQPTDPSRDLPPILFRPPARKLPGRANLLLHKMVRVLVWRLLRRAINGVRNDLGLAAYPWRGPEFLANGVGDHVLYGFSQHVVPRQPEWPDHFALPGYFVLDQADTYTPDPALERFLSSGPTPIYVGFGSMVTDRPEDLAALVLDALRRSGRRAVIGSGWAGLASALRPTDDVLVVRNVPHDWLLPRVSLAIHHCGAGTSAAAMRAGIPTVPVPFVGDQFFWGWQMCRSGAATRPLDRRRLTAGVLADAIDEAGETSLVESAARLGRKLRAENGTMAAVSQMRAWGVLPPASASPAACSVGAMPAFA